MKVLTVFDTCPETIEMAPVVNALTADPAFMSKVCVTAQQHLEQFGYVVTAADHKLK